MSLVIFESECLCEHDRPQAMVIGEGPQGQKAHIDRQGRQLSEFGSVFDSVVMALHPEIFCEVDSRI